MSMWVGLLWLVAVLEVLAAIIFLGGRTTKKWCLQDKISAVALLLNFLTFAGAVTGVLIAYSAFTETQRQADEAKRQADIATEQLLVAKADQRPWLDISDIAVSGDIAFDENGARIEIDFDIKNVGRTPAFDVMPWISASAFMANPPRSARPQKYQIPGVSILVPAEGIAFPGRSIKRTAIGYVSTNEVQSALSRPGRLFPVTVEVCVAYRISLHLVEQHKTCHTLLLTSKGSILILSDPLMPFAKDQVKVSYQDRQSIAF